MGKKTLIIMSEDGRRYSLEVEEEVYNRAHTDERFGAELLKWVSENTHISSQEEESSVPSPENSVLTPAPAATQSSSSQLDVAFGPGHETEHHVEENDEMSSTSYRAHWTRTQVLQLIASYKKFQHLFDSSTIRNEIVWKKIANDMGHHTGVETKNKFKYLKGRYTKKKDNMSIRSTGASALHFEFYEEFDEMFGNDPNIVPKSIASSSRNQENQASTDAAIVSALETADEESTQSSPQTPTPNRKRKSDDSILEFLKQTEEARERRHQQSIEAINKFNTLFEKFLEK